MVIAHTYFFEIYAIQRIESCFEENKKIEIYRFDYHDIEIKRQRQFSPVCELLGLHYAHFLIGIFTRG